MAHRIPTNNLLTDLPDFVKIANLWRLLYKRSITQPEARAMQKIWFDFEDQELELKK